jgi:hypothetical protein
LRGSHPSGKGFALSMFEVFDFPEIVINCTRRTNSTTPLQSLALINSDFMAKQARHFADRVQSLSGADAPPAKLIETACVLSLGRSPAAVELTFCEEHLHAQYQLYLDQKQSSQQAAHQALASLCLMLLASNEFLYIG